MGINLAVPYSLVKPEHIHFVYNRAERANFVKVVYSTRHATMNNCTIMIWNSEPVVYMSLYYIVFNIQSYIFRNLKQMSAFANHRMTPMVDMVMCFVMNLYKKYGARRFFLRIFGVNVGSHKITVSFRVF